MSEDRNILFPNLEVVIGEGERKQKVIVSVLAWPDAIEFLRKLGDCIGSLGKFFDAEGNVRVDVGLVIEMISGSDVLSTFLVMKATGRDEEWLKKLPYHHGLELLAVALEINLSDELLAKGKAVAGAVTKCIDLKRVATLAASAKPTSSSSSTATPAPT